MTMKIKISSFDRVKEFVDLVKDFGSQLYLKHGRYVVNAQSIMGILSLNIEEILELEIVEKYKGEKDRLCFLMKDNGFVVEEV